MESLKKWREPAAWLTIGVLALTMLLGVIELVVVGASLRPALALGIGAKIGDPTVFVVLAGIVASCVLVEPTPRARLITLLAVLTSVLALLAALLLTLVSLGSRALKVDVAGVAVTLVISGLAVAVLVKLFQLQPSRRRSSGPEPQHRPAPELPAPPLRQEPPDPQLQPTWQPDAAAGAAWMTARDAAAGAPAAGWGSPGEPAGWQPIPAAPTQPPAQPPAAGAADDPTARAPRPTPPVPVLSANGRPSRPIRPRIGGPTRLTEFSPAVVLVAPISGQPLTFGY